MSIFTKLKREPRPMGIAHGAFNGQPDFYMIGPAGTKENTFLAIQQGEQGWLNAEHLRACWNACQGSNPKAIKETMVFLHALPTLLKDSNNMAMIAERASELIALAKETE